MTATYSFSALCWAGTCCAAGSLILETLARKCRNAGYPACACLLYLGSIFLAGSSWTLLILTTLAYLRQI